MANSHPGSYCGQDAYNDMFVTETGNEMEILEHGRNSGNAIRKKCGGGGRGCLIKNILMQ